MTVTLTIRDVPEDVRDELSQYARQRGQSLQAFLLGVLTRQAQFGRNQQILVTIDRELMDEGGAGTDAPDAAEVLESARAGRGDVGSHPSAGADGVA